MIKKTLLGISCLLLSMLICGFTKASPFPELKGYKNTMNFQVYAPTAADAKRVAEGLESYYKRFLSHIEYGGMLKKKPQIFIFKDYQDYLDKAGDLGYNVTYTGGIAIPRSARKPAKVYSFLSANLMSEVLPHELTHLLFKEITAGLRTDAKIPLWLNEGMAVYEEEGSLYERPVSYAAEKGSLIPVGELTGYADYPEDPARRSLFYAQSASLVDYLLDEYGGTKFLAFSKKMIRDGKSIDEALNSTYYPHIKDVSQLGAAWLRSRKN